MINDKRAGYRGLAEGSVLTFGTDVLSRSPLFVAGGSAHLMLIVDTDHVESRPRLEVRLFQKRGVEWVALMRLGGGGGSRTLTERGENWRRETHYVEFEPPSPSATALRFEYYRGEEGLASEEVAINVT